MKKRNKELVESIDKPKKFKKLIESKLEEKVIVTLSKIKEKTASSLLEAEVDDTQQSDIPAARGAAPTGMSKTQPAAGVYNIRFPFMGKTYVVEFTPVNKSSSNYNARFFVKGQGDSTKVTSRFGISAVSTIAPLFEKIFAAIRMFLKNKNAQSVRLIPGEPLQFPSQLHVYLFEPLKKFEREVAPKYAVIRGDAVKDGSAFIVKRGGTDNIKSKSWKPGAPKVHKIEEPTED